MAFDPPADPSPTPAEEPARENPAGSAGADTLAEEAALRKMETAVPAVGLSSFRKSHPAPFWVFGEERRLAVRRSIIPAHWFQPGFPQLGRFTGTARPGEFFVFQVAVLAGDEDLNDVRIQFGDLRGSRKERADRPLLLPASASRCISVGGVGPDGKDFVKPVSIPANGVKPFWIAIQLPPGAGNGVYRGTHAIRAKGKNVPFEVTLTVQGGPVPESGTLDGWRLARLGWLDSRVAHSETWVTSPFIPIKTTPQARALEILGRKVTLTESGLPAQVTSYYSASNTRILSRGRDLFARAAAFSCVQNGGIRQWQVQSFSFTKRTPVSTEWKSRSTSGPLTMALHGVIDYEGFLTIDIAVSSTTELALDDIRLEIPLKADATRYAFGLGMTGQTSPPQFEWTWDVRRHQDAIWLGDVNGGLMLRLKDENYERPLINLYYDYKPLKLPASWGTGGVRFETAGGITDLRAYTGPRELRPGTTLRFISEWSLTPFKPLDPEKHFGERYFHNNVGSGTEEPAWLKSEGVNIVNIHHNKEPNPFINYPYSDASVGVLKEYIQKAHAAGLRVKIYYTTRELTQNLPEFFALLSLDGEIILPRREGVPWTIINPDGPHPWLREHVGMDIIPAWRETIKFPRYGGNRLDLAVITTPYSRWNNFYLEGLRYLVRNVGIDGLYIDDTALDRLSMRRARRILDEDGITTRRIDMHSWNHFNSMAQFANCSILFMELYPYFDRLWHGEGFDPNTSPEYWLVEMSGIPFGLMSEMLHEGGNPWRGMVFGMTQRWPWSGDPRNLWKAMDSFGITRSEFVGWWDPACPVSAGRSDVKVSVYRRERKTLAAIASWAEQPAEILLDVRWSELGLNPQKTRLRAPVIQDFQQGGVSSPGKTVTLEPGKGLILVLEEIE